MRLFAPSLVGPFKGSSRSLEIADLFHHFEGELVAWVSGQYLIDQGLRLISLHVHHVQLKEIVLEGHDRRILGDGLLEELDGPY